jgi:WD40 repeat protein
MHPKAIPFLLAFCAGLPGSASAAGDETLAGYSASVSQVIFAPDGKHLITVGSAEGGSDVRVWDPSTGRMLRTLSAKDHYPMSAAVSPDGKLLASGGWEGRIVFWSLPAGRELFSLAAHAAKDGEKRDVQVLGVAFSPDGAELASASYDGTVRFWGVAERKQNGSAPDHPKAGDFDPSAKWVFGVAYSPDGKRFARAADEDPLRQWERASLKELVAVAPKGWNQAWQVAYGPDGKTIAAATNDTTLHLWDAASGKELHALVGHKRSTSAVAFSPDGKVLASADLGGAVRLWDAVRGKELAELAGPGEGVRSLAFSPRGDVLLGAGGHFPDRAKVLRWDVRTRKELPW